MVFAIAGDRIAAITGSPTVRTSSSASACPSRSELDSGHPAHRGSTSAGRSSGVVASKQRACVGEALHVALERAHPPREEQVVGSTGSRTIAAPGPAGSGAWVHPIMTFSACADHAIASARRGSSSVLAAVGARNTSPRVGRSSEAARRQRGR
jgi:hypothetical protein